MSQDRIIQRRGELQQHELCIVVLVVLHQFKSNHSCCASALPHSGADTSDYREIASPTTLPTGQLRHLTAVG